MSGVSCLDFQRQLVSSVSWVETHSAEELSYCSCIKWLRHDIGKHVARIHFSQSYALPIHKILDPEVACRNVLDFSQTSAAADGDTRGCIHVDIDWAGNVPIFEHCLLSQRSTGRRDETIVLGFSKGECNDCLTFSRGLDH